MSGLGSLANDRFTATILANRVAGFGRTGEAGALIQAGGQEDSEISGLARGIVEMRTVLGRADTPVMHYERPVYWSGLTRIISRSRRLQAEVSAKTTVWLARAPHDAVRKLLRERPEWWQFIPQPTLIYTDIALTIAADLLIRDSERRCAAVLLRLSGRRFADPDSPEPVDVEITQDDLAGAANLSRSSVRSMLGRLAERGLIEQGYRGIAVPAPAALRAFVDEG
jgi:CRP-like cAMP-binding protein